MKKIRRLAVLCAVLTLMLCFTTVAYAANGESGTEEPADIVTGGILGTEDAAVFIPEGTGTVVNSANDGDGKQFYTIVTPAGNTFYLIIDLQRDSDNVYFLDAVTEKDLLALAEQNGYDTKDTEVIPSASKSDDTSKANQEPKGSTVQTPESQKDNAGMLFIVLAVVVIGGGAGYYFKIYRPKHQKADSEDDFDYSDESSLGDAEGAEPSDGLPPWDDEDGGDSEE